MKNLLNPKWIFLINTLPVLVLFFIGYKEFSVIKTLLDFENIWQWKSHTYWLFFIGFINFIYATFQIIKNRKITFDYAIFMLISSIAFIYSYYFNLNEIIPRSVPNWMLSGETMFYVGTFLMPTLAYSLFAIVTHFTPENKKYNPWINFGFALAVPLSWYIFGQLILPLWRNFERNFNEHFIIVAVISWTLFFLFFLLRGIFILIQNKSQFFKKYLLIWKILFALILPIIGLLANAGVFSWDRIGSSESGIFGDFNHFWFYFLVIFNGILLCIPNFENKNARFLLFLLRSITFAVTFYFFLVFLPFLPLSVIAIVVVGFGFLMLSPLILFVFHAFQLAEDFAFLNNYFSKIFLRTISIVGFLIIPTLITFKYLNDKKVLNETLEFVYTPNYSKKYDIDKTSLQKTLNVVKSFKENRNSFPNNSKIPYLTSYFNWLVFNNLTLSDAKISTIENIFFGKTDVEIFERQSTKDDIAITNISTKSTYDKTQKSWKTWVDFEMKDQTKSDGIHEFSTVFNLPQGCFVSDYYLEINGKKEFGILAEKKSAMWIFNQITSENRDPGILYYLTGNKIAFKVFPFRMEEVRKTGIEFLHKEPLKIKFEDQEIQLGNVSETIENQNFENRNVKYISAQEKQKLLQVQRIPYFVFLVDASVGKEKLIKEFLGRIENFKQKHPQFSENSKSYYVNSTINNYPLNDKLVSQNFDGGYFLERAIKKTLVESFQNHENRFPIIISVTDTIKNAILNKDFADLQFTFPENKLFYNLEKDGNLTSFSLMYDPKNEVEKNAKLTYNQSVLPYKIESKTYFLENDNQPSLILKSDQFELSESEVKGKNWNSAVLMQGKYLSQTLHPETENEEWLPSVKNSFRSKIMTPFTSYLVVENEAQKAVLKRKQQQILNSNKSFDAGEEEAQQMSEPSLWIFGILTLLFVIFNENRKKKIKFANNL